MEVRPADYSVEKTEGIPSSLNQQKISLGPWIMASNEPWIDGSDSLPK